MSGNTVSHQIICDVPRGGVLSLVLFAVPLINVAAEIPWTVQISIYADDLCFWPQVQLVRTFALHYRHRQLQFLNFLHKEQFNFLLLNQPRYLLPGRAWIAILSPYQEYEFHRFDSTHCWEFSFIVV